MKSQQNLFQLDPGITYLNCAYMSPLLRSVEEAGIEGVKRKRNPVTLSPEIFFGESEILRSEFAKMVNASDPKRIAIIPSVSYGMANVARNLALSKGDNIIVVDEQFPSNIYPWRRLADECGAEVKYLKAPEGKERGKKWNNRILDSIDEYTAMVAIGNIHWADGTLYDLKAIREKTLNHNAWLVIDGTQSVGALPINVDELKPDALIAAGYKWLMGPYSMGLAYYGPAFDDAIPVEENWINRHNSEDFSRLVNYEDAYQPGALRFDVGEHSNFILVPMMVEALKQVNAWGVSNIQQYCRDITEKAVITLSNAGYRIEDPEFRAAHLFGIRLGENHSMDKIKSRLNEHNFSVSFRGDSIRVSPNVYNTEDEMMKLADLLSTI
ncbi:aminotransferase class V-fold PLP-dependent enzyme [Balneola sp. MJW-20]|uniref:aminotransferase class V-fold PLP-dependent enzyme n=1 Tax=Gracilimonas aurantiaca TaxID=3234185 RepID=UPI003465650C